MKFVWIKFELNYILKYLNKYDKIRYSIVLFLLILVFLFGYWLKSQRGINIFNSYSLSDNFPFRYLKNNVIATQEPGILLHDSFDQGKIINNWSGLWSRENGKVNKDFDLDDVINSRCLIIRSKSKGSWSISYNKYIEVHADDIFRYKMSTKLQGDKVSAYVRMAVFDENRKVINWNYFKHKIDSRNKWIKVDKRIRSSKDIKFLTFRLSGIDSGNFLFDDIYFIRENIFQLK